MNYQYDYTFDWTMLKQRAMQHAGTIPMGNGISTDVRVSADGRDKEKQQQSGSELK